MVGFGQLLRIEDNRPMEVNAILLHSYFNFSSIIVIVLVLRLFSFLLSYVNHFDFVVSVSLR